MTKANVIKLENQSGDEINNLRLQANYQIEALALALQKAGRDINTEGLPYLVQGIATKIIDLNAALMMSDGDEVDAIDSLRCAVFGSNNSHNQPV